MEFLRKYGTGTGADVYVPAVKRGVVDFAVSADWTPASGDVKVSKDGAAAANIGTLPTAITMGNTAMWKFVFSDAELQCKVLSVTVADSATKAVEDTMFNVVTYGNASAMFVADLSVAIGTSTLTQTQVTGGAYALNSSSFAFNSALDLTTTQKASVNTEADTALTDYGALKPTTAGRTLDVSAGGEAGIDWANVGTPGSTVNLSATTVKEATDVQTTLTSRLVGTIAAGTHNAQTGDTYALANGVNGFVALKADTAATLVDTNELQTDWVNGGRLDLILDARASQTSVDTIDGIVDNILVDTAEIGAAGAGLTALAQASIWTSTIAGRIDAAVSTRLASASYTAPLDAAGTRTAVGLAAANLDTQLAAIAGYIDTEIGSLATSIAAILADTGTDGVVISAATAAQIADVVLRRTMANVEGSSNGDTIGLSSLYGMVQQLQESAISGSTLTVKRTDGSTTLGTKTVTTDAAADPVTGVS